MYLYLYLVLFVIVLAAAVLKKKKYIVPAAVLGIVLAAVLNKRSEEILDSVDHCGFHSVHRDFSLRSELFDFQETYIVCKLAL